MWDDNSFLSNNKFFFICFINIPISSSEMFVFDDDLQTQLQLFVVVVVVVLFLLPMTEVVVSAAKSDVVPVSTFVVPLTRDVIVDENWFVPVKVDVVSVAIVVDVSDWQGTGPVADTPCIVVLSSTIQKIETCYCLPSVWNMQQLMNQINWIRPI